MDAADAVGASSMSGSPFREQSVVPPPRNGWRDRVNDVDVALARLVLERGHTIRLDERLGVGVGERNDVAEDVVQRARRALAFLGRGHAGKLLELAH